MEYLGPSASAAASVGLQVADVVTVALGHGNVSHSQLVDLAGVVGIEQLAAQVTQITERWPVRAAGMVDAIMEGQAHAA